MKKLFMVAAIALMAACGGGKKSKIDARIVNVTDAPPVGDVCNVLADTGCNVGEKCTWVLKLWEGEDATGAVECAAAGPKQVGEACMIGTGGMMPLGSDNCAKGAYCIGGVCKKVCDPNGGEPMCGTDLTCATYVNAFSNEGEAARAGVCDRTCNPLTQKIDGAAQTPMCGGMLNMMNNPTAGCYGFWAENGRSRFSCAGAGAPSNVQDSVLPARIFINSCAPGFYPGLSRGTGTMQAICSAFCRPHPDGTFMGGPAANRGGQRPAGAVAGDKYTCAERNATNPAFDCIFGFLFEIDDAGMLQETKYSKDFGVCLQWSRYTSSQTMMPLKTCLETPHNAAMPDMSQAIGQGCVFPPAGTLRSGKIQLPDNAKQFRHLFRKAFPLTLTQE